MTHPMIVGVLLVFLLGCETTNTHRYAEMDAGFQDRFFEGYQEVAIETEEQVFAISPSMVRFIEQRRRYAESPKEQVQELVKGIFGRANMNLVYNSTANNTASQTFAQGQANCLSMTIMTYALADYAGMQVHFQQVEVPEFWERRDGVSLLNGHVNLRIYPGDDSRYMYFSRPGLEVDFDPSEYRDVFESEKISKQRVLAMFYNNKAADALVKDDYVTAYAYLKRALMTDPELPEGWVNLGVLYRYNHLLGEAEAAYHQALNLAPNHTALENLALLYQMTGRDEQAEVMLARIERQRQDNPYYHFLLGEIALDESHPKEAIDHYRDALKLDRNKHVFYFGLARAFAELGNMDATRRYLKKARQYADYQDEERRYDNKLNLLSRVSL
ncbi:hypothetical protein HMF8227_02618 [Saliniradius amylolyticus]|uniref:Uncharacterized protein n=2 Tax=Saliniradius amylolyticus TaxID=2183582 RepID=A0A2S2E758_9ALTE|nr:hypothetical protein HMF8227_02618 [Saliniradius amylolyticus]